MTEINKDDVQSVIDARLQSIKDSYMDEGAMWKLKNDLLHETRAEQVEANVKPGTRLLQADVFVMGQQFHSEVELSQYVPHVAVDPIQPGIEVHRDDLEAKQAEQAEQAEEGQHVGFNAEGPAEGAHAEGHADEARDADLGGNAEHHS